MSGFLTNTDGFVVTITESEHYDQHSDAMQTILKSLDGYGTVSGGSDGYLAFFTGTNSVAGDNDLYWDRVNNRLGIHTTTPSAFLDVGGNVVISKNGLLQMGGTTSVFPAIKRVGEDMWFRKADDSTYTSIAVANIDAYGTDIGFGLDDTSNVTVRTGGGDIILTPSRLRLAEGVVSLQEIDATPTSLDGYGSVYMKSNNILYFQDGDGMELIISGHPVFKSYSFASVGSGVDYVAGFYEAPAAASALDQAGATVTLGEGSDDEPWGAHAFVVASGAGATDSGDLVLTVSGTSMTDAGVRTNADSEVIVADATAASTDDFYETIKKWVGQITFTLASSGGPNFNFTFNYGFNKYEDFGNKDFTLTDMEFVGRAGASTTLDIEVLHQKSTGWTYDVAAFVPGTTPIAQLTTDYSGENNVTNGESFAWKRAGLSTFITGSESEGIIVRITGGGNSTVDHMSGHLGVLLS